MSVIEFVLDVFDFVACGCNFPAVNHSSEFLFQLFSFHIFSCYQLNPYMNVDTNSKSSFSLLLRLCLYTCTLN